MSRLSLVLLSLWSTGCCFGRTPATYPSAQSPRGTAVTITTTRDVALVGELLAVTDTALVVYGPPGIVLAPYVAMREAWFPDLGLRLRSRVPDARQAERLRLHSRFPQGIGADLLQQLLERYEQPELVVVRE